MAVECDLYSQIEPTPCQHSVGFIWYLFVHAFNKYDVCSVNQIIQVRFIKVARMNLG